MSAISPDKWGKKQKPNHFSPKEKSPQTNVEPRSHLIPEAPKKCPQFWLFSSLNLFIKDIGMICSILGLPVSSSTPYQELITILDLWILSLLPHSRNSCICPHSPHNINFSLSPGPLEYLPSYDPFLIY